MYYRVLVKLANRKHPRGLFHYSKAIYAAGEARIRTSDAQKVGEFLESLPHTKLNPDRLKFYFTELGYRSYQHAREGILDAISDWYNTDAEDRTEVETSLPGTIIYRDPFQAATRI